VLVLASVLVPLRSARADGSAQDLDDGNVARARSQPDLPTARADFERAVTSSDAYVVAAALYFLGEMDDEALDFKGAVAHFGASAKLLPSSRYASRATLRRDQLESHAEGDFAPLVRLELLRRDPALSNDPAAIASLVHDAEGFPRGPVRAEARLLAAEAYRGRFHRPDAEVPLLWAVVHDPGADRLSSEVAAIRIVDAQIELGDLDAAERAVHDLGGTLDPSAATRVARLVRRRSAHAAALGEIGLFVALLTVALLRKGPSRALAGARRILPLAAAFSLFAAGGGGLLAASYETGSAGPFLMLGPTMLAVILLSRAWSSIGSRAVAARVTRSALSASSLVAVAFLVLERLTPQVLDGLGL
jgi:hypothetical protein